jgi:hypothetical protein
MGRDGPVRPGGQDADGTAADQTEGHGVDGDAEDVDHVDERAGRLPCRPGRLQAQFHVLVAHGVEGQEGGSRLRGFVTGELPVDDDDPPGEQRRHDLVAERGGGHDQSLALRGASPPRWKSMTFSTAAA